MKEIHDIGLSDVKMMLNKKEYQTFTDGQPNIIGIRNIQRNSNAYNDKCWVFWHDGLNEIVHNYTITTHPGFHYLKNPIAGTYGTAILVPGQYIGCWELAMHRGKQFALCQHLGQVRVYRDNNKDTVLDFDPKTIDTGFWGIDIHSGSVSDNDIIDRFSAGCQVFRYHEPHAELMDNFKLLSERNKFHKFSYTLIGQEEF